MILMMLMPGRAVNEEIEKGGSVELDGDELLLSLELLLFPFVVELDGEPVLDED